ncbi:MAG: GNAT family N-acetyltransferase [Verrucomicrobia bacterium]|nr:GNAT family N-acetyltransferase [Verrucomicrobiota bacterium]
MKHATPIPATHRRVRSVLIRQATVRDLPEIIRLRWEDCGGQSPAQDYDEFANTFSAFLADKFKDRDWGIIVGDVGEHLVGTVCIQKILRLPAPKGEPNSQALLSGLHVDRTFWSRGLQRDLLENAALWARQAGVSLLLVSASEASASVFRQFGFATADGYLQLALGRTLGEPRRKAAVAFVAAETNRPLD